MLQYKIVDEQINTDQKSFGSYWKKGDNPKNKSA